MVYGGRLPTACYVYRIWLCSFISKAQLEICPDTNDTSGRINMALRADTSRWMDWAAGVDVRMILVEPYS